MMSKNRWAAAVCAISAVWVLAGCGVETATTAATAAQMKAQEAEQAKQQLEKAQKQIDAAQQLSTQRLQEVDQSLNGAAQTAPATGTP